MPTATLQASYRYDPSVSISVESFKRDYLYGIDLCTVSGERLSDRAIAQKIAAATARIEMELEIDISPQLRTETCRYELDDFRKWGYIEVTRPVQEVVGLSGHLGNVNTIDIPTEWISLPVNSHETHLTRTINLLPHGTSAVFTSQFSGGLFLTFTLSSFQSLPNFWRVTYRSGFRRVPADILDVIGKTAVLDVYNIVQDTTLGGGIASRSLSIDGLSESITTTSSAMYGSLSAKSEAYRKDLDRQIPLLRSNYRGLNMVVL